MLRSSWATVNIGDVAHSPGVIAAFRAHAPEVEIVPWPVRLGERERVGGGDEIRDEYQTAFAAK